jgi:hypothetical protein
VLGVFTLAFRSRELRTASQRKSSRHLRGVDSYTDRNFDSRPCLDSRTFGGEDCVSTLPLYIREETYKHRRNHQTCAMSFVEPQAVLLKLRCATCISFYVRNMRSVARVIYSFGPLHPRIPTGWKSINRANKKLSHDGLFYFAWRMGRRFWSAKPIPLATRRRYEGDMSFAKVTSMDGGKRSGREEPDGQPPASSPAKAQQKV